MEKIFNRTVLKIAVGVYVLAMLIGIFVKLNHFPIAAVTINIIFYMKILFYAYLLIYVVHYLSKLSMNGSK